jgi:hypothetical protein
MRILAVLAGLATAAGADDKADLAKAAAKLAEAGSYTFKVDIQTDAPFPMPSLEGKFHKEAGTHVKAGERGEFFRKGEKTYLRQGAGDWQDAESFRPAGGQGGGGRRRGAGGLMMRGMGAPHEELKGLENAFKELKREEEKLGEKSCSVYSGELTKEGIAASPLGKMAGQFGAFGGGALDMTGSAKAWVDPGGNLVRLESTTRLAGEFNGNAFEFSFKRTTDFSDVGKTAVETPEGVKMLVEEKPAEKSEDPKKKDF